jgi:hypothetical protein
VRQSGCSTAVGVPRRALNVHISVNLPRDDPHGSAPETVVMAMSVGARLG